MMSRGVSDHQTQNQTLTWVPSLEVTRWYRHLEIIGSIGQEIVGEKVGVVKGSVIMEFRVGVTRVLNLCFLSSQLLAEKTKMNVEVSSLKAPV